MNALENLQAKIGFSAMGKPAIIGLTALLVMVAVLAGRYAIDTATATEIELDRSGQATQEAESGEAVSDEAAEEPQAVVFVHVSGAVNDPGLVEVPAGCRVADAIRAAGGSTDDASLESVNLARKVEDGEHIHLPSRSEATQDGNPVDQQHAQAAQTQSAGMVNINNADAAELETLPGIGPSTAAKIVADREASGPFKSKEDLMRVSGIGEKKFAAVEDLICL